MDTLEVWIIPSYPFCVEMNTLRKAKSKARNVKEKDYPEIFTYKRSLF